MEALLLVLNSIAVAVLVIMGLRDDRRKPGTPQTSLFRYSEAKVGSDKARKADAGRFARGRAP